MQGGGVERRFTVLVETASAAAAGVWVPDGPPLRVCGGDSAVEVAARMLLEAPVRPSVIRIRVWSGAHADVSDAPAAVAYSTGGLRTPDVAMRGRFVAMPLSRVLADRRAVGRGAGQV